MEVLLLDRVLKDWDGHHYEKYSGHQREWGNTLIDELSIVGDERILDLGCGNGLLTRQLAGKVPNGQVIGIDSSPGMLEVAKEKRLSNMTVQLMDINDLYFDQEFDIVFSNATLHWIHDHEKLLKDIYGALKTGGYMRLQFAAKGNCPTLIEVLKLYIAHHKFVSEFTDFKWPWFMPSVEEYEELMRHYPFTQVKVWTEKKDRVFVNEEELIGFIDDPSLIPFIKVISSDRLCKDFREAVINKMLSRSRQKNGTYYEAFHRLNVFAVK